MLASESEGNSKLDDFLNKSYRLHNSENFEYFLRELGVTRTSRIQASNSKPIVTLTKRQKFYILCTDYPEGRIVKVGFLIGKRMQRRRPCEGRTNSLFEVDDNKLTETMCVDGKKVVVEREFHPKNLIVTMTVNDVKCTRSYTEAVVHAVPSYGTETSRRMSVWDKLPLAEQKPEEDGKSFDENMISRTCF